MSEIRIKEEELILDIATSYDINTFDIRKYEGFIDRLCDTREYQKEAIRKACIYLLGGRYRTLEELARENFASNTSIREKHGKIESFFKHLPLKDKLSCNIDLATGTGKSFVIYGVAQIMLCEWKIDRVLVLCPSITIKEWLKKKFDILARDINLKNLLPETSAIKNPHIRFADGTIESGDICIENIHSTYKNTKSAIEDSLIHHGNQTLILNDEAHHIFSGENADLKKWFEFLSDTDYNFRYIVGFTGTPYTDSIYFSDIIYRYGIYEAMEQKFVKSVDYIKDSEIKIDATNRMQIIYQNHQKARTKFFKVKPVTIFISKDIKHCETDRKSIMDFLIETEWITQETAEKKVIIITSHKDHKTPENLELFHRVNESSNPVEWICSVAMLTEWWDVPNVFQIVPSEEKAFNSKLLISQVIGRGLRIPDEYRWEELHVKILNHTRFSESINHLVDEVLDKEEKLYSYPVEQKKEYDFPIYNLIYSEEQYEIEKEKIGEYSFEKLKKEWITLPADLIEESCKITFQGFWTDKEITEEYIIKKEAVEIEDIVQRIYNGILAWDKEQETNYTDEYDKKTITGIVQKSLAKAWITVITKDIASKCLQAFGTLKRFWNKNVRYNREPKELDLLSIDSIGKSGISLATIRKQKGYIYYDENSEKYSLPEDIESLKVLEEEIGKKYLVFLSNSFLFKTSFNLIHTTSNPEREFIQHLTEETNTKHIDAFIKSKDRWFYNFEYSWRKGEHPKIENFNPDFFIKSGNTILVIEIKWSESEKEYSTDFIKNRAKYQQAKKHFEALNAFLKVKWVDYEYRFHFCSPKDYKTFFKYLQNGHIGSYVSRLDYTYEVFKEPDTEIKKSDYFDNKELLKVFWSQWEKLEENSRVFLATAEKNYFDNRENGSYSFSGGELTKTFELELKLKLFDKIRDNEDISYAIMDEESAKDGKQKNQKLIDFLNYKNDFLDLWAMETALKFNTTIKDFIRNNIPDGDTLVYTNIANWNLIKDQKFEALPKDLYKDFPNFIALLRLKYRNDSTHGDKVISKEEFEELRNLMIFEEWVLVNFIKIL